MSHTGNGDGSGRQHSAYGPHFLRRAAITGFNGAELYLQGNHTYKQAADQAGSCVPYVEAMVVLIQTEDTELIRSVLCGDLPVLGTARMVKARAKATAAYQQMSTADKAAFGAIVGPGELWDSAVAPAIR
jgi:hypothetical protein